MKTIVAATNFSEDSVNAVRYAADMACVTGTDLLLVHVCPYPVVITEAPSAFYSVEEMVQNAEREIRLLKEKMQAGTGERISITTLVKEGDIVDGIDEACASVNTYLVVIGRSEKSEFRRFLQGTKTGTALKQLSWPLVTVPQGVLFAGIRNIGVACDFREVTETLPADEIKCMVKTFGAALHVLHVSHAAADTFSSRTVKESGWFHELMADAHPQYHFIYGDNTEAGIIEFADKNKIDMLIVIPKKHDLMGKVFKHSHSRALVLHAHTPVMAIHE
jgi:nucleotide-binding universal stress UspA family protein